MPLARHDLDFFVCKVFHCVSTHMPLARHDHAEHSKLDVWRVSTHMPLARHDYSVIAGSRLILSFYSHASCEA